MWQHIDVQAHWRSWTYGRAPQCHSHVVGFFNVNVQAPKRDPTFLYGDSDTPPNLVARYDRWGYVGRILILSPRRPHGGKVYM